MATLVTTYLEMTSLAQFRPAFSEDPKLLVMAAEIPSVPFYRFLYDAVGKRWSWRDRNAWSDERVHQWLARPSTLLYVLYVAGTPAGYIELDVQPHDTQIAYFGLIPSFFGNGYGKHLLSYGIQQAWDRGAGRVWVHTCNLDSPHALPNYQKRGFQIYDVKQQPMPEFEA